MRGLRTLLALLWTLCGGQHWEGWPHVCKHKHTCRWLREKQLFAVPDHNKAIGEKDVLHRNDYICVYLFRVCICFHKRREEKGGGVSERRIVRSRGNQGLLLLTEVHLDGYVLHCLSPNQPQSINHLPQPASQINHLGSAPTFVPARIRLHWPIKCHSATENPISEHLGQHSIFKYRLINLNEPWLKSNFRESFIFM